MEQMMRPVDLSPAEQAVAPSIAAQSSGDAHGGGSAPLERDHAATSMGGALGGRPRRLGRAAATQGAGGTW